MTAFRWGVVAGFVLPVALPLLLVSLPLRLLGFGPPEFDVEVFSRGADVTRHGGAKLELSGAGGGLAQACVDGCDDLWFGAKAAGDQSLEIAVRDASGACVLCNTGAYVTGGYGSPAVLHIRGDEKLTADLSYDARPPSSSMR